MRKKQVIEDQAKKDIVLGTKTPPHMLSARTAINDAPCVTLKPGKFMGRLTALLASAYGAETTDVKRNSVGICKVMSMAASDSDTFLIMCDYLSTSGTTKSFFGQGESRLVAGFEQLSTGFVI